MTTEQFISEIAKYVQKYAPKYNIKVHSPIIAQAILESARGTSELAVNANNYFGLKYRAGRCPTACGIYYKVGSEQNTDGSYTSSAMQWMKFSDMENGVIGYFDFTNISTYSNLKGVTDPEIYLKNIKADGYATSLNYVENVMAVIKSYNLTQYDNSSNISGGINMGYTNSPLVDYVKISPNKTVNRTHAIDTITIHCVVGQVTVERLGEIFTPTSRQASSNYGIGLDGRIGMYVEEKDRSWCSSNAANDHRAVTIEVASDTTDPYTVTDKAYAALLNLLTDICKRNNIKELKWSTNKSDRINHINGCNMTVHRDYAAKSCPGEYLYSRHGDIANEINKRLGVTSSQSPSSSSSSSSTYSGDTYTVVRGDTLSGIGAKLKIAWKNIADLNGIKSPYIINVGQVLKLPTSSTTSSNNSSSSSNTSTPSTGSASTPSSTYTVVKGDTLSGIGAKLKIDWKNIAELNGIKSPYVITVGQVLKLPTSGTTTSGSTAPSVSVTKIAAGTKLNLKSVGLFASSSAKTKASTKTGTYYVWSDDIMNNRIRITNSTANVGKSGQITGWIDYEDAKKSL